MAGLSNFTVGQIQEMAENAALDKNKRYYTSTPEMLKGYAAFVPLVDEQK